MLLDEVGVVERAACFDAPCTNCSNCNVRDTVYLVNRISYTSEHNISIGNSYAFVQTALNKVETIFSTVWQ